MSKLYPSYLWRSLHLCSVIFVANFFVMVYSGCQPVTVEDVVIEKSIAILPFTNISDDEFLITGNQILLHDVWTHISQVPDLFVISPTSTMHYTANEHSLEEIGTALAVKYVIRGETRIHEGRLHLDVELMRINPDYQIWQKEYEHSFEDLDVLAHDLSFQVAKQLHSRFDKRIQVQTESISAHNLAVKEKYLEAQHQIAIRTAKSINTGLALLEDVVNEEDPNFAAAHSLIAEGYLMKAQFGYDDFEISRHRALISALAAIEIDPLQGTAHAVIAASAALAGDYAGATSAYSSALEVSPNNPLVIRWFAHFQSLTGNQSYALELAERGFKLDPHAPISFYTYLQSSWLLGKPELTDHILNRMIDEFPNGWITQIAIADHAAYLGEFEKTIEYYEKALEIEPNYFLSYGYIGHCYGRLGLLEEALAMKNKLLNYDTNHYALANIFSGMGDANQAFEQLSLQMRAPLKFEVVEFLQSVWSEPLREDPRYYALCQQLNLIK